MDTIKRIREIESEGCGIPTTDSGNGSAGPSMIDNVDIERLLDEGGFDGYDVDHDVSPEHIREALDDLGQWDPQTHWVAVSKVISDGDNPYTHTLILWTD